VKDGEPPTFCSRTVKLSSRSAFAGIAYGTSSVSSPLLVVHNLYLSSFRKKAFARHVPVAFRSGIQTSTADWRLRCFCSFSHFCQRDNLFRSIFYPPSSPIDHLKFRHILASTNSNNLVGIDEHNANFLPGLVCLAKFD